MQCRSCGFENMPGLDRCARCRGQLVADTAPSSPGTFMPPRPGVVTKFFRPALYWWLRLLAKLPARVPAAFVRLFPMTDTPPEAKARVAASIIPGLGHLLDRRRRTGVLVLMVWLVLLVFYLNSLARWWEWLLFGLILTMHATAAYDAGNLNQFLDFWTQFRRRLHNMMFLLLALGTTYLMVIFVFGTVTGRYLTTAPAAIPGAGIQEGDIIVFQSTPTKQVPARGDVVTMRESQITSLGVEMFDRQLGVHTIWDIPLWVMALPGDTVSISRDGVKVNDRRVPAASLPQNLPLPLEPVAMRVADGYIMAVMPMQSAYFNWGGRYTAMEYRNVWQRMFQFPLASVHSRAVGIYLPLTRRGGLHPGELAK